MSDKTRQLAQRDWDQLMVIAAGFLPLTNGDLSLAMSKALVAHAELIENVRRGKIVAELARGTVRLLHQEGNLVLVYERRENTDPNRGNTGPHTPLPLLGFSIDEDTTR
ncbi:MAG: hypothetical protein ABMA64_02545 [Myxococcota bacterium]